MADQFQIVISGSDCVVRFCIVLIAVPLEMYRKFGQPNAEISRKIANGQLLFLAL